MATEQKNRTYAELQQSYQIARRRSRAIDSDPITRNTMAGAAAAAHAAQCLRDLEAHPEHTAQALP